MCGRFTITLDPAEFEEEFDLENIPEDYGPRYNVAPSQGVWIIRYPTQRKVEKMRWGLVPFLAKDLSIGSRMINARAETLQEKPSFRTEFQKRRCINRYEYSHSHYYLSLANKPEPDRKSCYFPFKITGNGCCNVNFLNILHILRILMNCMDRMDIVDAMHWMEMEPVLSQ